MEKAGRFRRAGAGALAAFLFVSQGVLANAAEANLWSERRKSAVPPPTQLASAAPLAGALPALKAIPPAQVRKPVRAAPALPAGSTKLFQALSETGGAIRAVSLPAGPARGLVIHIEDIHLNPEAQKNISDTIRGLAPEGLGLIALEGAAGALPVTALRSFPDGESARSAVDRFWKANRLPGPVHAALTADRDVPVVGVDDAAEYARNVRAYRASAGARAAIKKDLATKAATLAARKDAFNPALRSFDRDVAAFRANQLPMATFVQRLASRLETPPPSLATFAEAASLEASLDLNRATAERATVLAALAGKLDRAATEDLLSHALGYRSGAISHAAFYRYLERLCANAGVDMSAKPAFCKYLRYVVLAESIDGEALFRDVRAAETAVYGKLAVTDAERALISEDRHLYLSGRLAEFAMTPEEWTEYRTARDDGAPGLVPSSFEAFYDEADVRDARMADGLLAELENRGEANAVLVAGGFHSAGLRKRLTAAGYAVATFTPKITSVDLEQGSAYLAFFTRERTPIERLFAGRTLFLAPPPLSPSLAGEIGSSMIADALRRGVAPAVRLASWFNERLSAATGTVLERVDHVRKETVLQLRDRIGNATRRLRIADADGDGLPAMTIEDARGLAAVTALMTGGVLIALLDPMKFIPAAMAVVGAALFVLAVRLRTGRWPWEGSAPDGFRFAPAFAGIPGGAVMAPATVFEPVLMMAVTNDGKGASDSLPELRIAEDFEAPAREVELDQQNRSLAYLDELAADYGFLAADAPLVRLVSERLTAVLPGVPAEARPRIRVLARTGMGENAFISGDGTIVVSPELIAYLDNIEEIDAVLLHETNHWVDGDFAATAEAAKSRDMLRIYGTKRFNEYKADMRGFFQAAEPERDSSPLGMIQLAEKMRALAKSGRRTVWNPVHGSWDDRVLNMKTMLQILDMFNLDRPLRPIDPALRAAARALPLGKRIERATEKPDLVRIDAWRSKLAGILADADAPLLNRAIGVTAERLRWYETEAGKRRLYPTENENLEANRTAFNLMLGAWNAEFDRRHAGLPPAEAAALRAIELEIYASLPVITNRADPIVAKSAAKRVGDSFSKALEDGDALASVGAAFRRLSSPFKSEKILAAASVAVEMAVGPNMAFDTDDGIDVDRLFKNAGEAFAGAAAAAAAHGFTEDKKPARVANAWTDAVTGVMAHLIDVDQWKKTNKRVPAAVNAAAAVHPVLVIDFDADAADRLEKKLEDDARASTIERYVRKNWPATRDAGTDKRMAQAIRAISKLKKGDMRLDNPAALALLSDLAKTLADLPELTPIDRFPQLEKAVDFTHFKAPNERLTMTAGEIAVVIATAIHDKRKFKSSAEAAALESFVRVLIQGPYEFRLAYQDTTFFNEMASDQAETLAELDELADIHNDATEAGRILGVKPREAQARTDVRRSQYWRGAALAALQRDLKNARDDSDWFARVDAYARKWGVPTSREQQEDLPRKTAIVTDGLARLGPGPLTAANARNALLLTFFVTNPGVRLTVQEHALDLMIERTDPIAMLDLVMRDYTPQGAVGGFSVLTKLEDRLETVEDVRRFSAEGRRVLEGLGAGAESIGIGVAAEGGLDYFGRRKSRGPLLFALLKTSQDDEALRGIIEDAWWELVGGEDLNRDIFGEHDNDVTSEATYSEWAARDIKLERTVAGRVRQADAYPDGILQSIYAAGIEARYALLRKLLVGENGVLINTPAGFVNDLAGQFINADADRDTAEVIRKVLHAVFDTAPADDLYLLLHPIMLPRIGRPPRTDAGWASVAKRRGKELASGMENEPPFDMRQRLDLSIRAHERMLEQVMTAKVQRLLDGTSPDLAQMRANESGLLALAPKPQAATVAAMAPMEFILESARQLGAPGVRFLQLLGQMVAMPDAFRTSFLSVYDDMRGQSKSSALETITREMPAYAAQIKRFVGRLGGGSLFTVFEVELKDGTHEVVRVLNPNALYHAEEALRTMEAAIGELIKENPEWEQVRPLLGLLREWITTELKDETFRADDAEFSRRWNGETFPNHAARLIIPESRWDLNGVPTVSRLVRREQLIGGPNAKNLTKLSEFPPEKRRELVSLAVKHYAGQIMDVGTKYMEALGSGGKIDPDSVTTLVHSDVSPGNLRVTNDGNLAILDRGMYLRLTAADAMFLGALLQAQTNEDRADAFINQVADLPENADVAGLDRAGLRGRMLARLDAPGADPERAFAEMLVEVHASGLRVPLKYTLLFKNLNALNRMAKEADPSWNVMTAFQYDPAAPEAKAKGDERAGRTDGATPASLLYLLLTSRWVGLAPSPWVKALGVAWVGIEAPALFFAFSFLPAAAGFALLLGFVAAHAGLKRVSQFYLPEVSATATPTPAERIERSPLARFERSILPTALIALGYFAAAIDGSYLLIPILIGHVIFDALWIVVFGPAGWRTGPLDDTNSRVRRVENALNILRGPRYYHLAVDVIVGQVSHIHTPEPFRRFVLEEFMKALPQFSPAARRYLADWADPFLLMNDVNLREWVGRQTDGAPADVRMMLSQVFFSEGFDRSTFRRLAAEDPERADAMFWAGMERLVDHAAEMPLNRYWALLRLSVASDRDEIAIRVLRTAPRAATLEFMETVLDLIEHANLRTLPPLAAPLLGELVPATVRDAVRRRLPINDLSPFTRMNGDDPRILIAVQALSNFQAAGLITADDVEPLIPFLGAIRSHVDPNIEAKLVTLWTDISSDPALAGPIDAAIVNLVRQAANAAVPAMRGVAWNALTTSSALDPGRLVLSPGEAAYFAANQFFEERQVRTVLQDVVDRLLARLGTGLPWSRAEILGLMAALYGAGLRRLSADIPEIDRRADIGVIAALLSNMAPLLPDRPAFGEDLGVVLALGAEYRRLRGANLMAGPTFQRLVSEMREAGDAADVSAFILKVNSGVLMETSVAAVRSAAEGKLTVPAVVPAPSLTVSGAPAGKANVAALLSIVAVGAAGLLLAPTLKSALAAAAAFVAAPWLAISAGSVALAAGLIFRLRESRRQTAERARLVLERTRRTGVDEILPPLPDFLLRKSDGRGLLSGLTRGEAAAVARELERTAGPEDRRSPATAQRIAKDMTVDWSRADTLAAVAGKKDVAIAADAGDLEYVTRVAAALGENLLYVLVSAADRPSLAALEKIPNVRILIVDGALTRGTGASRTVHLAAIAQGLSSLTDSERGNLLLALNDADVVDKDGLSPALERVLAPVQLALLNALMAVPITRVQLDTLIDVARAIAVQA